VFKIFVLLLGVGAPLLSSRGTKFRSLVQERRMMSKIFFDKMYV